MEKSTRSSTARWTTIVVTAFTLSAAVAQILQYLETSQSPPKWVSALRNVPPQILLPIMVIGLLVLLLLGSRRLSRLEEDASRRQADYAAWIQERGREISDRCISEYRSLEKKVDDFVGTSTTNLETALGGFNSRLAAVESRPRQRPPAPTWFRSHGFYWELTHNFWTYATSFDAEHALSPGDGGILGPLCPNAECKVDVSDALLADRRACPRCGSGLAPTIEIRAENRPGLISVNNSDPLFPLKKAAYRDAQAAMRRGEVTRPQPPP